MNQNVVYVGLDVDDVQYHGSALDRHTGEVLDFRCNGICRNEAICARWWRRRACQDELASR